MKQEFKFDKQERDSAKKQGIQEAMNYILEHNYGQVVLNTELSRMLGYNLESEDEKEHRRFRSTMARIKNFLVDYGYILKSINGTGYYILKPQHITAHCFKTYTKKSQQLYDKTTRILEHTDTTNLTATRKEEFTKFKELNEELSRMTSSAVLNSEFYTKIDLYNSLED